MSHLDAGLLKQFAADDALLVLRVHLALVPAQLHPVHKLLGAARGRAGKVQATPVLQQMLGVCKPEENMKSLTFRALNDSYCF